MDVVKNMLKVAEEKRLEMLWTREEKARI